METKNIDVKRFSNKLLNHGDNLRKVTAKVAKNIIRDRGDSIKTGTAYTTTIKAKNDASTRNEVKNVVEKRKNIVLFKAVDKNKFESKISEKDNKDDQRKRTEDTSSVKMNEKINQKVPLIKTMKSKNDIKSFNITFTEPKQQKSLRINIPSVNQKSNGIDKVPKKLSKTNITKKSQRFSSPVLTKKASPPTEISKWSPYSRHATSYYEAWVNFASNPKNTSKSLKKNVLQFQKQLERLGSSAVIHENFTDEKFTGKIKVNHR